jgi:hypothetical protein
MRGERDRMMQMIRGLRHNPLYLEAIRSHLEDYFSSFQDDTEFLRAIDA